MKSSNKVNSKAFSVEFYPPRTEEGRAKLDTVHAELAQLRPDFFSVTYGAGGSTRDGTRDIVLDFNDKGSAVAPHLSFGGSNESETEALIQQYREAGISRLVALRGDMPSGTGSMSQYRYANELVDFVRKVSGNHFHIDVACYPEVHPQSLNFNSDIEFFKLKVNAGANSAITQYFYNADSYFYFVDCALAKGIDIPVVPGIMPITNFSNLTRFSSACGAEIPRWITQRLQGFADDKASLLAFGEEVVSKLCERLLEGGAPGLHFYSMNQTEPVRSIWQNLNIEKNRA